MAVQNKNDGDLLTKDTDEDKHNRPDNGNNTKSPCTNPETSKRKDTAIHDQDSDFDQCQIDKIDKFIDIYHLICLVSIECVARSS